MTHFKDTEYDGINMLCPDGQRRLCHPVLCPYIADYPEQTLLCCIKSGWCPRCTMLPWDYDDVVIIEPETMSQGTDQKGKRNQRMGETNEGPPTKRRIKKGAMYPKSRIVKKTKVANKGTGQRGTSTRQQTNEADDGLGTEVVTKRVKSDKASDVFQQYLPRTQVENQELRARAQNGDDGALSGQGLKADPPFTDIFQLSDIHSMIAPDLLHQASKMLYDNLYAWITEYIAKALKKTHASIVREIDTRFSQLPPYIGLKSFATGISRTERWTGNEYKAMVRVLLPIVQDLLDDNMVILV